GASVARAVGISVPLRDGRLYGVRRYIRPLRSCDLRFYVVGLVLPEDGELEAVAAGGADQHGAGAEEAGEERCAYADVGDAVEPDDLGLAHEDAGAEDDLLAGERPLVLAVVQEVAEGDCPYSYG